jgi:restriction system protein
MNRIAREAERAERARLRDQARHQREMRRLDKLERAAYLEGREDEAAAENDDLESQITSIQSILISRIDRDPLIDFKGLFRTADEKTLDDDPSLTIPPEPVLARLMPAKPNILIRWLPGVMKSFQKNADKAKAAFDIAQQKRKEVIQRRTDAFAELKAEVNKHNNSLIELAKKYSNGDPKAVTEYFELIIQLSEYPESILLEPKTALVPESKQLVIEVELPPIATAIPSAEKYRYVKKTDELVEVKRSEKSRHSLYAALIAQTVLRCLYEICTADTQQVLDTIVLNAHVSTLDPATGHQIHPCLVSVRISRESFLNLDLRHVDPIACLKQLKAAVSSQPGDLLAVRPILELNMVDPRFIQETDVLSSLDQRPNLMELSPSEFESLITNLFGEMGLETRLTQASRDGGVDCVAFDARPILGGKVVIQAKRYKNTVGVAAVRDLFGTLHNEGASKGILVTTSGFGKAAYDFANGKPIELITGSNLLFLLKEHAEVDARIEAPPDWVDPRIDLH